jgi:hypothetical protein
MAAWPIKFTEGSKSGKKHPLPIDLSTENKKAKRSAYEKERFYYSSNEYFDIKSSFVCSFCPSIFD